MGHESSSSPKFQMTRACTRAPHPRTPRHTLLSSRAGPQAQTPGTRVRLAGPRSPPHPGHRAPLAGPRRSSRHAPTTPRPAPAPNHRARPNRSHPPASPGRRSATARPLPPRGSGPVTRRRPGGQTHIRSGTSRRPSTIMSGRKSSLKAEVMFAARALRSGAGGGGARGRVAAGGADGQGQVRAASPRRPPEPALVTFSLRGSPPIPADSQRPGRGLPSARCGDRGRSSVPAAPPLNPCGPARPAPGGRRRRRDRPLDKSPPHPPPPA